MRPLLEQTMGHFIKEQAVRFGAHPAIWSHSHTWSYTELDKYSDDIACGLLSCGIGRGSHVAIWAESISEKVFFFYALQKLGAVAVMINHCLKPKEAENLAEMADVEYLAMTSEQASGVQEEKTWPFQGAHSLKGIIILNTSSELGEGCYSLSQVIHMGQGGEDALRAIMEQASPTDPALILFTSGTTGGQGKAVVSSSFNLVNGGIQKADSLGATEADVFCCALPLCHIFGIDVNLLAALASGGCLALPDDNHSQSILTAVQEAGCTLLSAVPSIFLSLMARKDFSTFDCSRLRAGIVGGAYCPPETFCAIERAFSFTLLPGLGQTEATAGIAIADLSDSLEVRSTTVGHFVNHMEGKLLDLQTGDEQPLGTTGEVCVRGPLLMTGYYKDSSNDPIDDDGWLHTGDLGFLDNNGNLHLRGRIKEIINRGGEKIIPQELEDILRKEPGVQQCKVIGIPDAHYGEAVCACIQKRPEGIDLTESDVYQLLCTHLAHFKVPKYILFFDSLPCTETGKVRISELQQLVQARLEKEETPRT